MTLEGNNNIPDIFCDRFRTWQKNVAKVDWLVMKHQTVVDWNLRQLIGAMTSADRRRGLAGGWEVEKVALASFVSQSDIAVEKQG